MMTHADYAALGLQAPTIRCDPPVGPPDVASVIERAAAQCPDDEALVDSNTRYSFSALDGACLLYTSPSPRD